jgi:molybdopterin molybdotransferase
LRPGKARPSIVIRSHHYEDGWESAITRHVPTTTTISKMASDLPSYEEAAAFVALHAQRISQHYPRTERIALTGATGRILAASIAADDDQPPFSRSTRDGYACRAAEASAHIVLPIAGATHAGESPAGPLPEGKAWEIMTGAPVPAGADCVVMLEHVEKSGNAIRLIPPRTIAPGDNVVAKGAQARRGDEQLPAGTRLGPAQIALAASCGYAHLDVYVRPRVAILTTGDELVPVGETPGPGKIRNSNAPMLAALVASAGAEPIVLPTAADTAEALDSALAQALETDMLLISGGVSAGKYDLVEPALARFGAQFHFTGVRIQPGKPLVFGQIPRQIARIETSRLGGAPLPDDSGSGHDFSRAKEPAISSGALAPANIPLFGLPGNPISSAATFHLFAAPILAALAGSLETHPRFVLANLTRDTDRKTKPGLTRFLPALCGFSPSINEFPQVEPVPWQGSGDLTAFARSNCFLVIQEDAAFLTAGSTVRILLH